MTRINIVSPSELTDQHLVAEYGEMLRIGVALQKSLQGKTKIQIPKNFVLGTGHMKFFYDKGTYLEKRYYKIREEMINRGMKPDLSKSFNIDKFPDDFKNDWTLTEKDATIIRERLKEKISQKPNWYKYYGKPLS
jgi:deoxyribonuclease (pyrimidine dimer)